MKVSKRIQELMVDVAAHRTWTSASMQTLAKEIRAACIKRLMELGALDCAEAVEQEIDLT